MGVKSNKTSTPPSFSNINAPPFTQEFLKDLLHYDPNTGLFKWKNHKYKKFNGNKAGYVDKSFRIKINQKVYYAHVLAYYYMTGVWNSINHKDDDKLNNKFDNLRPSHYLKDGRYVKYKDSYINPVQDTLEKAEKAINILKSNKSTWVDKFRNRRILRLCREKLYKEVLVDENDNDRTMFMKDPPCSQEKLKTLFVYNKETGDLLYRNHKIKKYNGVVAGSIIVGGDKKSHKYLEVRVLNKKYKAHTLVYYYNKGIWRKLDHRDGNTLNNKLNNLRPATYAENNKNKVMYNPLGFKGVIKVSKSSKFASRITVNYVTINLGCYKTAQEAHDAYCIAAKMYHKEFANTDCLN